MRRIWIALIVFYQRWLSPYKGFHCAHAAIHKQLTCSEAVKQIIEHDGLWGGRKRIRRQFRECRFAAYLLRSRPQWAMARMTVAAPPAWPSSAPTASTVSAIVLSRDPTKPPIRPEFAGGGGRDIGDEDTFDEDTEQSKPDPSSYFKTRKSTDDCGVCCLDAGCAAPCDAGPCDAGCDGCDLGCL